MAFGILNTIEVYMALIINPITGQEYTLTDAEIKHITVTGDVIQISGQLLDIIANDLKDFVLRTVVDENDVMCLIFVPRHGQAKRWYQNWHAVRAMKLTNQPLSWCRDYVKCARGISYANEDAVIVLTSTLFQRMSIEQYRHCLELRGYKLIEHLRNLGYIVGNSVGRTQAALDILKVIWNA